jgi:TonB-dependent receptor
MHFNSLVSTLAYSTARRLLAAASLALLALALLCPTTFGQTSTGSVQGRISDAATGKSLQGAIVKFTGTNDVTYTNAEGRFTMAGVSPGNYQLTVEYVGLDPYSSNVTLAAGQALSVNATLDSAVLKLSAFTVAESARGQALAINQQKTASGIVNIVSEETFGQMISGNIGYTLQRLPGLSVNEDEDGTPNGVNIRGMESKYNSFQTDGFRTPTSGNSRGFATSQLLADGVSNIEVVKAPTADRDGDAIGGIINTISRSAFERDGREIKVTTAGVYYDMNNQWSYDAGLLYSDILSVGGGTKNLGVSFTVSAYETSRAYDNVDLDYFYVRPTDRPDLKLTEPLYFHSIGTPQTNFRDVKSWGLTGSFDYRLSANATLFFRPSFSHNTTTAEKPEERIYVVTSGGAANVLSITPRTGAGRLTNNEHRYQNRQSEADNDLFSFTAGGEQRLDTIKVNYSGYYAENERNTDRSLQYVVRNTGFQNAYDRSDTLHPKYTNLNGKSAFDTTTITRGDMTINPSEYAEEVMSAKVDVEKSYRGDALSGKLKFGLKTNRSTREQDSSSSVYVTGTAASGFPYADIMRRSNRTVAGIPMSLETDIPKLEALFRSRPELFVLQAPAAFQNSVFSDFLSRESTHSAYVMGAVTKGRTTLTPGLRMERNTFESTTNQFIPALGARAARVDVVNRERTYNQWLPSAHLRHELGRNLILRGSYNRSYSRPDLDDLLRGRLVNIDNDTITDGNPDLQPTTSDNFDAQLEFYTANRGLYSVGAFYKTMEGFYYDRASTEVIDENGVPTTYRVTRPENALGAVNYGLELIARQKLVFLPKPFDGFGVDLSATFTESDGKYPGRLTEKLPTYGFSDFMFNAALEYTIGRFRSEISYRYRSDFLEGLDFDFTFDDIFAANERVDFVASYQVSDRMKLFLNMTNLTNRPQVSYQGFAYNPEDYTMHGMRATTGVTYRF